MVGLKYGTKILFFDKTTGLTRTGIISNEIYVDCGIYFITILVLNEVYKLVNEKFKLEDIVVLEILDTDCEQVVNQYFALSSSLMVPTVAAFIQNNTELKDFYKKECIDDEIAEDSFNKLYSNIKHLEDDRCPDVLIFN